MKLFKTLLILVTLAVTLTPLAAVGKTPRQTKTEQETSPEKTSSQAAEENEQISFKVLLTGSGRVIEVSTSEYLTGVLAAEMPMTYHEEALKAQALASYTFAVRQQRLQRESPDEALKGADLTDSGESYQGYYTQDVRREKWGDKFEKYESRAASAAKSVGDRLITFEGEPIMAAFHSICSGKTESAEIVWGKEVKYLKGVDSIGDKLSPDYSSSLVLTCEQFAEMAKKLGSITLEGDEEEWVGKLSATSSGFVKEIEIGGKKFDGKQVREAFNLRSANFTLTYKKDSFTFSVVGYGHGVGLSQYGSDYMARQGSSAEEIVCHYYSGAEII